MIDHSIPFTLQPQCQRENPCPNRVYGECAYSGLKPLYAKSTIRVVDVSLAWEHFQCLKIHMGLHAHATCILIPRSDVRAQYVPSYPDRKIVSHCHDRKKTTRILSFVCDRFDERMWQNGNVSRPGQLPAAVGRIDDMSRRCYERHAATDRIGLMKARCLT